MPEAVVSMYNSSYLNILRRGTLHGSPALAGFTGRLARREQFFEKRNA